MEHIKSSYHRSLSEILNDLIKNYLYNIYKNKEVCELKVVKMVGITNYFQPFIGLPNVILDKHSGMYKFFDAFLLVSVEYCGEVYEICLKTVFKQNSYSDRIFERDHIFVTGLSSNAERVKELVDQVINDSIKHSYLRNKVLSLNKNDHTDIDICSLIKIIEPHQVSLDKLFLPENKKEQIKRFIHTVKNYNQQRISLRYLFNGKPGTGKTQIISSIINEIKGSATVIFYDSPSTPIRNIFELCKLFEPCVLIIDDLDFLAENRITNNNKMVLRDILQALDGLLTNNVFLLAATNDKKLVDDAASRPERFDMVFDIGEIEPSNYLSLIQRETNDEQIISFFDEKTLMRMRNKNITGAFIVSLIKQLHSAQLQKGELTRNDFIEYLNLSHKGFYSYNDDSFKKAIGFNE